jgi:hypothetical protein
MKIKGYLEFLLLEKVDARFDKLFDKIQNVEKITGPFMPELKYEKEYMEKLREDFAKKIKGLAEYFDSWYSKLASDYNANPEEDFAEMQRVMDKTGFTLSIIKKLFDKKVCELTSEYYPYFIHQNNLDTINGYIDIYLYLLDEKLEISKSTKVKANKGLSGGQDEFLTDHTIERVENANDPELDEWLIKYAYGYHKTPYGKLLLKQAGLTPDEFVNITCQKLLKNVWIKYLSEFNIESSLIEEEIEEDGGLIKQEGEIYTLYIESFYELIGKKIKKDFETFKEEFISWLQELGMELLQIEDEDMVLKIKVLTNLDK